MVKKNGFTLLEIIIAIAIIAILGVVLVPNLRGPQERLKTKTFVAKLNSLMQAAWQQALTSQKLQMIYFDFTNKKIELREKKDLTKPDKPQYFTAITGQYLDTQMTIPPRYFFRNFYIEGKDELQRKAKDAWFFIVPSGLAQAVIINIVDEGEEDSEQETEKFGLVLNPFNVQFDYYDKFQQP